MDRNRSFAFRLTACLSATRVSSVFFANSRLILFIQSKNMLLLCLLLPCLAQANTADMAREAHEQGKFEQAARHWQTALAETVHAGARAEISAKLAAALQAQRLYRQALTTLERGLKEAEQNNDKASQAILHGGLGDVFLAIRQKQKAGKHLDLAADLARARGNSRILAEILMKQGRRFNANARYPQAMAVYQESARLAEQNALAPQAAQARINIARLAYSLDDDKAMDAFMAALQATRQLKPSHIQAYGLIALSRLAQELAEARPSATAKLSGIARQSLLDARQSAERIQDSRALSHAYGRLGQLYKDQPEDAVRLTRQALFHAGDISELAYRWRRQLGSLFKAQGKRDRAIEMHYQALEQLRPIRRRLTAAGYRSERRTFQEEIAPVHYELADLLLQRAKTKNDQHDL
ncbi:MAG: hypothetical protein GY862_10215, partial [Gammaproteobacteria bacterium]|nr:hypothetical protein [Gammaproteobacteria bacterium]